MTHQTFVAGLSLRNFADWSSRDLSLVLQTSRDPFLQVLVSVLRLGLEPQSLGLGLGLGLALGTSESWSWSWSWNPQVSVSVLVLGLETMETRTSSLTKGEIGLKWHTVTRSKSCIYC